MKSIFLIFKKLEIISPLVLLIVIVHFAGADWMKFPTLLAFTSHEVVALQALVFAIAAAGSVNFYHHIARMKFNIETKKNEHDNSEIQSLIEDLGNEIKNSLSIMAVLLLATSIIVILSNVSICNISFYNFSVLGVMITTYLQFYIVLDLTTAEMGLAEMVYSTNYSS